MICFRLLSASISQKYPFVLIRAIRVAPFVRKSVCIRTTMHKSIRSLRKFRAAQF